MTTFAALRTPHVRTRIACMLAVAGLASAAAVGAVAQDTPAMTAAITPPPAPTVVPDNRWQASLDAFAEADKRQLPPAGGVVFVGSSSIRLWNDLESQFAGVPIVKRGFGGSRLSDVEHHVTELVLPYKPRLVIVYAGDNDLAEGRSPHDVLQSFRGFVDGVHAALPNTRIAFLSIKPSPLRESLLGAIRETNALVSAYTASAAGLDYIDVYSKMVDADGKPRRDLFQADALHMNAAGYAIWQTAITDHLR